MPKRVAVPIPSTPSNETVIRANVAAYGARLRVGTTFQDDAAIHPGQWPPGLLERSATMSVAPGCMSKRWMRAEALLVDFLAGLCRHPESDSKDGLIALFAALGETGSRSAERRSENVRSLEALVCDIDGGASLSNMIAAAMALKVGFVLFTSPSSSPELPKARIVFPLAETTPIEALGDSLAERKELFRVFHQLALPTLKEMCDPCSWKLAQAHNLPRHRPGGLHVTIVQPGPGIPVPSLDELREQAVAAGLTRKLAGSVGRPRRPPVDFAAHELRCLRREVGTFLKYRGDRLDLVAALDAAGWDMFEGSSTKCACRCPNDAQHSNPDDPRDRGCFVASADDREDGFAVLHCAHAHCAQHGAADLLAMALHQLGLADPIGYLHSNLFEIL